MNNNRLFYINTCRQINLNVVCCIFTDCHGSRFCYLVVNNVLVLCVNGDIGSCKNKVSAKGRSNQVVTVINRNCTVFSCKIVLFINSCKRIRNSSKQFAGNLFCISLCIVLIISKRNRINISVSRRSKGKICITVSIHKSLNYRYPCAVSIDRVGKTFSRTSANGIIRCDILSYLRSLRDIKNLICRIRLISCSTGIAGVLIDRNRRREYACAHAKYHYHGNQQSEDFFHFLHVRFILSCQSVPSGAFVLLQAAKGIYYTVSMFPSAAAGGWFNHSWFFGCPSGVSTDHHRDRLINCFCRFCFR